MGSSPVGPRPSPVGPRPPSTPPAPAAAPPAPKQDQTEKDVVSTGKGTKAGSTIISATQTAVKSGQRAFGSVPISQSSQTIAKGLNTPTARVAGTVGVVANAVQLPIATKTAAKDIRAAIRNPSDETINKAVSSSATAAKTGLSMVKDGLSVAGNVSNYRAARSAATTALQAAQPAATKATVDAASKAAANAALKGASRQVTRAAVRTAAGPGAQVAATAARAALKGGGTALAKAAGRFAPGANIAIAALDTANAVATVRDPNASTGKKVTSVITAVGSIAAATNIPVVSQAGAIVSGISSFVGSFF